VVRKGKSGHYPAAHFLASVVRMLISSRMLFMPQLPPAAYSVASFMLWGTADFAGGYGSRRTNAFVLTAFAHICAFAVMLGVALVQNGAFPDHASVLWALAAGAIGGFALALFYRALASGQMGLSAPIAAMLSAGIPTLVDVALEGAPSRWTVGGILVAIAAIWLITRPEPAGGQDRDKDRDHDRENDRSGRPQGVAMAALAGVGFAGFYLCIHQATGSPAWIAVIARVASFVVTAVAVLATRAPLRIDRAGAWLGALAGVFDISANVLFIYASHLGRLDEAVVITSLYPAMTVVLARIFLKEHFSRWRLVGLMAALAAVPMIAAR
jgi:drug/metabolite transporter (DMT)-like permease